MTDDEPRLMEFVDGLVPEGFHGATLRDQEKPVVYTKFGDINVSAPVVTADELVILLDHILPSREKRKYRIGGSVQFIYSAKGGVKFLIQVTGYKSRIHLEVRKVDA